MLHLPSGQEINIGERLTLSEFLWTLYTDHCMSGAFTWELESNDQVPVRTIAKLLGSKLLLGAVVFLYSLIVCRDVYFRAKHEYMSVRIISIIKKTSYLFVFIDMVKSL